MSTKIFYKAPLNSHDVILYRILPFQLSLAKEYLVTFKGCRNICNCKSILRNLQSSFYSLINDIAGCRKAKIYNFFFLGGGRRGTCLEHHFSYAYIVEAKG